MSKQGILELNTPTGWIEVEIRNPSVLENTPVEIYTPNGWAAPRLVDPADADTPLEVYTAAGWKGIAQRMFRMIDSFEDQDIDEYYTSSTNWRVVQNATYSAHGDYALESNYGQGGSDAMWSDSGMGLDHYPGRGDTIKTTHYLLAESNGCGHQYGCTGDGRNIYPDGYSTRLNFGDSGSFEIVHQDPDGGNGGEYTIASAAIDMTGLADQMLEIETHFGNPTITATLYDSTGSQITQISGDDADYTSTGFGWITTIDASLAENQYVYSDFARIIA